MSLKEMPKSLRHPHGLQPGLLSPSQPLALLLQPVSPVPAPGPLHVFFPQPGPLLPQLTLPVMLSFSSGLHSSVSFSEVPSLTTLSKIVIFKFSS